MAQTAARVGVLQPFKVQSVREETRNVVLYDSAKTVPPTPLERHYRPGGAGIQAKPFRPKSRPHPAPPQRKDAPST